MQRWQEEIVQDILENSRVVQVPSNGSHERFYTESLASFSWDAKHHLMDLEKQGSRFSVLTIFEMGMDGALQVKLTSNEVDDLLAVLLRWRLNEEAYRQEGSDISDPL